MNMKVDPFDVRSVEDVRKEEHLSSKFLKVLNGPNYISKDRPQSSLIELTKWVKENFAGSTDKVIFNNKIVIDGSFLTFAEQNNIEIKCLYNDSITSWEDEDIEVFVAQGIFRITYENFTLIHASLFHKGNQNEDEVSFFIIINRTYFHKYVELRNKYDKWLLDRSRSNLEIRVVGGDDVPYKREYTWDDVFLPTELKKRIKNNIEGFLKSEELYKKANIPWRRGILLWGEPGCGKTSLIKIIMSCYNLKPVTITINGHNPVDEMIEEAFAYANQSAPSLLFLEDINVLLTEMMNVSHFLQLMDGVSSKSGVLVVGTANDLSTLTKNVTDRPSRFDNKFEIPLPDKKMAARYLEHWLKDIKDKSLCKKIAERAYKSKFSYAYLEEIYVSAAFMALNAGKSKPNAEDVENAFELLLEDKREASSEFRLPNDIGIHTYEKK